MPATYEKIGSGPIRTCAGCRTRRPQSELMRVARSSTGEVSLDHDTGGRSPGRGAYLCRDRACVARALRGSLGKTLKLEGPLPEALKSELEVFVEREGSSG